MISLRHILGCGMPGRCLRHASHLGCSNTIYGTVLSTGGKLFPPSFHMTTLLHCWCIVFLHKTKFLDRILPMLDQNILEVSTCILGKYTSIRLYSKYNIYNTWHSARLFTNFTLHYTFSTHTHEYHYKVLLVLDDALIWQISSL